MSSPIFIAQPRFDDPRLNWIYQQARQPQRALIL